ncbi:MAG: flagellar hook-basal body complex protein FliE [Planctomycetales bacterium]|nr:flagellar hook-basal body complex protein FliE [Planctomycetales bacterium]
MQSAISQTAGLSAIQINDNADLAKSAAKVGAGEPTFQELVGGLIEKANAPHLKADAAIQDLATGKSDNVHGAVLAMVEADMSFRMTLEIRNRLTEAYQEIMRMQV